ncbi:unnamed protein product [Oikopleura dioica]|uniref:Uncharacterized protein n=1 Tax=Oikopleura dioica TaxID=34765 RepID=E4YRG1_OIKDI|nr:unnamed protein product [Oikopleura dioica]
MLRLSLLLENYSKAHGRLFQIPKEMGNNLSLITGYRAMSDLSGWCYWNGTSCLATQEEIPFGLHIEPTLINWAKEDDIDCSAPAISNALNSALSRFTKNITLKKRLLIMINI